MGWPELQSSWPLRQSLKILQLSIAIQLAALHRGARAIALHTGLRHGDTLGSQPVTSRQPHGPAGQAGRASVQTFSQVRPAAGRSTPRPAAGPGPDFQQDQEFEANATDAFQAMSFQDRQVKKVPIDLNMMLVETLVLALNGDYVALGGVFIHNAH